MLAFCVENGKGILKRVPRPKPKPGEALIKVLRAGICNTDLEILKGYMGFQGVLGHEFLGKIVEINDEEKAPEDAPQVKIGDRVNGDINLRCNNCPVCKANDVRARNHCPNRTVLGILNKDGTFAEYLTLPLQNLHKVPDKVSDTDATFTEPLAAACRVVEQGVIGPKDRVLVVGDGKLGLLCSLAIGDVNRYVTCLGKHHKKLSLLTPNISRRMFTDTTEKEMMDSFDVVVECSGTAEGLMFAAACTKSLGTVVLKSTCAAAANVFDTAPLVIKELRVVGSRCGPFDKALALLEKKKIAVGKMLVKAYPLKEAGKALKHAASRGTLKVQLTMGEEDVKWDGTTQFSYEHPALSPPSSKPDPAELPVKLDPKLISRE